jgi:asparagine synthase (glutamine-hydrolysing)
MLRRWTSFLQEIADSYTPKNQLRFYTAAPDFNDARRIKDSVYGPAMRNLLADNPFKPTDIGPRAVERIPAAIIRLLFDTWLTSNSLSLGDRVSMGVGVESRLPFLDVRLIELVMALRNKYPDHTLGQKAWLRAALKGVLPDDVLARPKAGFQPPVWEWLSGVVTRYGNCLRDGHLVKAGILADKKTDYVLQELPRQGWPGLFFAYKLVLLEQWFQEVVA